MDLLFIVGLLVFVVLLLNFFWIVGSHMLCMFKQRNKYG
jgi:hypothetical protein